LGGLVVDEIRLAVRRLRKRPSTTLASIVTLALAIAAAAATWSIITAVLLKPLQVPDPDRLVLVDVTYTGPAGSSLPDS
jgi:putative ABC transport system permease protein